jgi:hypothetical protein
MRLSLSPQTRVSAHSGQRDQATPAYGGQPEKDQLPPRPAQPYRGAHIHTRRPPPVTRAHCSPSHAPHTHPCHLLAPITPQLALLFGSFHCFILHAVTHPHSVPSLSPHPSRIHPKTLFASVHRACCSTLPTTTQTDSCRRESFLISVGGAVVTATVVTTM